MKKILLLFIASSSISLMGMDDKKQIIPIKTPSDAPSAPPATHEDILLKKIVERQQRMLNDEEYIQLRAIGQMERREQATRSTCPQQSKNCVYTVACGVAMPITLVADCVSCPCQCYPLPFYATRSIYTWWKKNTRQSVGNTSIDI
jgi:hypothetical protein